MIAGTLTILDETRDEPLDSWYRGDGVTGIDVTDTQTRFDGRPIQRGVAATSVTRRTKQPTTAVDRSGETAGIVTEQIEKGERIMTEWVADITGTGLLAIESIDGDGQLDFPLDMFYARAGSQPIRQVVDVEALHIAWADEGELGDVWLNAAKDGEDGSTINYHQQATEDHPASIGLGFKRPWNGTVMRGVVYNSGYLAVYNCSAMSTFVQFVEEELLEFTEDMEDDDGLQQKLGDSTDGDDDE